MPVITRTALVPYSAEQMYDLVNDVEAYPQYLPWCRHVQVVERAPERLVARIEFAKGPIHQSFTTANVMEPGRRIDIRLVEGPFKSLHGTWDFRPLPPDGSAVDFQMEFQVVRGLLGMALGKVFNEVAGTLVDAFCRRARQIYGPGAVRETGA